MKLKEHLKAQGWTDDQIAAAFADQNTLNALDTIFGTVTSERDALKARDAEWQEKLEKEYNPAISKAEREAMDARRRAADLEEQLKIAKDYGYLSGDEAERRAAEAADAAKRNAGAGDFDPRKHNLVTMEDVTKFADAEGEAIALATDLSLRYRRLTGNDIDEYETVINGNTMTGMRALRKEAQAARKPLDQYVAEKFDFQGKTRTRQESAQKDRDDKIRNEAVESTRREMAEKYGNPNLAMATQSRQPFIPAKSADGKQPWERGTDQQRRAERIQRAMQSQVAGATQ